MNCGIVVPARSTVVVATYVSRISHPHVKRQLLSLSTLQHWQRSCFSGRDLVTGRFSPQYVCERWIANGLVVTGIVVTPLGHPGRQPAEVSYTPS